MTILVPLQQPVRINKHVYEAIETAIVHGELPANTEISDRRLADMLEVSRTPVRDALLQLEAAGLVVRKGGIRWAVAGFNERDVRERFEIRRLLEPVGLERLAVDWDVSTVTSLTTMFAGFPSTLPADQYTEYLARDNQFHNAIVECSENRQLILFYHMLEKHINRVRYFLAPHYEGRIHEVAAEHQRLCLALEAHDLDAARRALLDHLNQGEEKMVEFSKRLLYGDAPQASAAS